MKMSPGLRLLLAATLLLLAGSVQARSAGDPYLGFANERSTEPPGMLINVVPGSPAEVSGLKSGDIVLSIEESDFTPADADFTALLRALLSPREVGDKLLFRVQRNTQLYTLSVNGKPQQTRFPLEELPEYIAKSKAGDKVSLTSEMKSEILELRVTLGLRPDSLGEPFPPSASFSFDLADHSPELRTLLGQLIQKANVGSESLDLVTRLENRAAPDDGYKLERLVYLLRDGLKGEALTWDITNDIKAAALAGSSGYGPLCELQAALCDTRMEPLVNAPLARGISAAGHLTQLGLLLERAAKHAEAAFAGFSREELAFIESQRDDLTEVFRQHHYIDSEDEDPRRREGNLKLLQLARRVDYGELHSARMALSPLADSAYLAALEADLRAEYGESVGDVLLEMETGAGRLVISGSGRTWQSGEAPALLIDLGGDDFYTSSAGSASSQSQPIGVLIELGGNDAYESTRSFSQGSGSLGVGLLIDGSGDDQYVGLQWAQGCGFFGCGALIDLAGNDVYRGEEFCQAAGIFGSALLYDIAGNDRMEGQMKCQAFGGSLASALIVDGSGNDFRYCKGKYETGYGDPGIFDAWGQGCAMGFRGFASGGIAGVVDLGGSDYCEAGNFSQGGGYYFGYGFHCDLGHGSDHYLGSRYNQGFCAHQAVGVFLEEGGNDHYSTRQAVAQGLAWDECATMFVDYSGNDTYEGGGGFSQGASAHNAICVFWDRSGQDTYNYPAGQGRTGGNDYHGGTSLSLFIDEGGGTDSYNSEDGVNNAIQSRPEHGFFCDLPRLLKDALSGGAWQGLWKDMTVLEPAAPSAE